MQLIFLLLFSLLIFKCGGDVKSTNGRIKFDIQSDGTSEMTLNSNGLGIGIEATSNLHVSGNAFVTNQVFVGLNTGSSNLNLSGTIGHGITTYNSNETLGESSIAFADTSSDNLTLTLPYAGNVSGQKISIKKISNENFVIINGGGNTIDQNHHVILPSNNMGSITLFSNGSNWLVINQSSDSTTWTPLNISSLGWFDASDTSTMTLSSGNVSQWDDKSGNDFHVTQSTGTEQPEYGTRKINSLDAVDFDGSDDSLRVTNAVSDGNIFLFAVFNIDVLNTTGFDGMIVGNDGSGGSQSRQYLNDDLIDFGNSSDTISPTLSTSTTYIAMGRVEDTGATSTQGYRINGGAETTSVTNRGTPGTTLSIGNHGTTSNDPFNGLIGEVIIARDVDDDTREKIEGYLAHKWGISSDLPANHPYIDYAP